MKAICCCLCLLLLYLPFADSTDIITSDVLSGDEVNGLLAAFGDFNADKLTDIFFITNEGKTVVIYLAQLENPLLNKSDIACTFDGYRISSVVPGDYNGDNRMDVLVTLNRKGATGTFVKILWGNLTSISNCTVNRTELEANPLKDQPLILDYDANKIPDVYGETLGGQRQVWLMGNVTLIRNISVNPELHMRQPHSNAFLDLNNDMTADIFVTSLKNNDKVFEIWPNEDGRFKNYTLLPFNLPNVKQVGQSAFADFNVDGIIDHVVPVCFQPANNCSIYIYYDNEWSPLVQFDKKQKWNFFKEDNNRFPITLRIGDFDLDGYPDVMTILTWTGQGPTYWQAVLFENKPCDEKFTRCLVPKWNYSGLSEFDDVVQVAFYDIYQDGTLDFLLVRQPKKSGRKKYKVEAIKNSFAGDVCFLKVLVVSGLCYSDCPENFKPYGVNQPGPFVYYNTTRSDGNKQSSCAAQLSQSAYFALQLPYTVFGLGQMPNFVDSLGAGLPRSVKKETNTRKWPFIIPNSQVVIIPLEEKSDYRWMLKLFVTPSHQILMTFIALSGTCLLVAIIIGGLHWKEKVEDKKEKLQESHRFHFDAM